MLDLLAQMKNHVIVVGHGRMGAQICQSLVSRKQHFVVVDRDSERLTSEKFQGGNSLPGEGENDEILRKAGINRAKALVAANGSDSENLFVVTSAQLLNSHVTILARADHEANEAKMTKAGANQVIRPFVVDGTIMANLIMKPNVIEFISKVRYRLNDFHKRFRIGRNRRDGWKRVGRVPHTCQTIGGKPWAFPSLVTAATMGLFMFFPKMTLG